MGTWQQWWHEWRYRVEVIATLIALAILIVFLAGCSIREIQTPTQASGRSVSVTVRALAYHVATPLSGVHVYVDNRDQGTTDETGVVHINVTSGREISIGVGGLAGWQPMIPWAAATLYADGETWTFYLEPTE